MTMLLNYKLEQSEPPTAFHQAKIEDFDKIEGKRSLIFKKNPHPKFQGSIKRRTQRAIHLWGQCVIAYRHGRHTVWHVNNC